MRSEQLSRRTWLASLAALLLLPSPPSLADSFVEYQGQQIQLKRTYADFHEYKDDPQNLGPGQADKVAALMRKAPFGPVFANAGALNLALQQLTFPGYGMFYANQLGARRDPMLELAYVEMPMQEKNRYVVLEKVASGGFRVVADFVAQATPEITRVRRGRTGELLYGNSNGMTIKPKLL